MLQKLQADSEILCVKNPNYYDADKVTLNSIKWVYDNGENPDATYNDAVNGVYAGVTLGKPGCRLSVGIIRYRNPLLSSL